MTTTQIRVYQLSSDRDEQELWLQWWSDVRALRERHGFRIVAAVLDPENGTFTWLVEHDGDFAAAEQEMMTSRERATLFARDRPATTIITTALVRRVA